MYGLPRVNRNRRLASGAQRRWISLAAYGPGSRMRRRPCAALLRIVVAIRLRESGADLVERCRVSLEESSNEGIATGAEDQLAFIEVEHLPARSDEYRRSRTGSVDVFAGDRLRRRGAVTR